MKQLQIKNQSENNILLLQLQQQQEQQTNLLTKTKTKMMISKAIILPFFLLAGIASGSQQPQGIISNTYYGEDNEGDSLQRSTVSHEEEVEFGSAGAANLEEENAVHSTDFYENYENDNADEEVVDESRRQLRGNNNRRLIGDSLNCFLHRCPRPRRDYTCWRKRVGSNWYHPDWTRHGVCVRNDDCLPSGVFSLSHGSDWMKSNCCSGRVWSSARYRPNSTAIICS